jgi:carbon-monoxide dehydrogenase medium subunit
MKPAPFKYHRAETLDDATGMLAELENARLLSGGQSLMPMMNLRYVAVDHLIDINPVAALAGISIEDNHLRIGGMTRQRSVLESDRIVARAPIIREALGFVGHVQTRNRGTVGGSLAHMDPSAELMGLASLMDAEISMTSRGGERRVAITDYPLGYMTPNIEPDEILSEVRFDLWPDGHGWDFREFAQRHGDFAIVGVGSLLSLDNGGRIERAAVTLIGVDDGPIRLGDVEAALVGEPPGEDVFQAAGNMAAKRELMGDALVTSAYRQKLADVLVRRSLARAAERVGEAADA